MIAVEFFLPTLPPSKNELYTVSRGRMILTREYRAWKKAAGQEIMIQRVRKIKGSYKIDIYAKKPDDLRLRDLGNILEATEDLLTWMQVIEDDHLSEDIHLHWGAPDEGVIIRVESFDPTKERP
jgi:Holliday junction resolvase RusA-like endonuclease